MMKRRFVVGLDGSEYADAAVRMACEAARLFNATLSGIAVVDTPGIEASSRGAGIGAYEYARSMREQKIEESRKHAAECMEKFEQACREAGVHCDVSHRDAVPVQAIADEGRYADMIVVGLHTFFHHETQSGPGDTFRRLLETGVCPVLAVPKNVELPSHAVIACDGSMQSSHALRAYAQLAAASPKDRPITLLHIQEGSDEDKQVQLDSAKAYLEGYGFEVTIERREGKPSSTIAAVAEEKHPCVMVMGAFGRRGIQKVFFGSTAAPLIEQERWPMFIYH